MNMWDQTDVSKKLLMKKSVEVIAYTNPVRFDFFGQYGARIESVEIERFYYNQGSATQKFIGIIGQGSDIISNEAGHRTDLILTVPSTNGIFDHSAVNNSFDGYVYNGESSVELTFISRDNGSLEPTNKSPYIQFNSPYLLRIIFEISKPA